jgi:hypothetical protein
MPNRSEIRQPWLVAFCACLALLASSSVALASGGSSAKTTIDPEKVGSATASCPRARGVIAGGFASPRFSPANDRSAVARIGSRRLGKRRLKTTAYNFGSEASEVHSFAYCSRLGLGVRVSSEKVFVAPQSADVATATCPRDSKAVAGGFATPGFSPAGPRVLTVTSRRAGPSRWRVEAFNIGGGGGSSDDPLPGTLVAYAYCLDDAPRIVTRKKRTDAGLMGKARSFKVRCPRRMKALSGGFDGNVILSANATGAGTIVSRRAGHGRAWRFGALSISEHPAKVTGYAYCAPRHR